MKLKMLLLAAAVTALSASSAMATHVITVSWTGKVASGTDNLNLFGGGDLTGTDFSSSYTFKVSPSLYSVGTLTMGTDVYPFFAYYSSAPVSMTFSVGGQSYSGTNAGGGYSNLYAHYDPEQRFGPNDTSEFEADGTGSLGSLSIALFQRITTAQDRAFADLGFGDFDGDVSDTDSPPSSSFFDAYDPSAGVFDDIKLKNQHLTIANSVTASVPEPATWGMMLVGFGVMGAAIRTRRKVAVSFG